MNNNPEVNVTGIDKAEGPLAPWLRIAILWLMMIPVALFLFSGPDNKDFLTVNILPQAPRIGEPLVVTVQLVNDQQDTRSINYNLYSNGKTLLDGSAVLAPGASQQFRYIEEAGPDIGRQTTFLAKASMGNEKSETSKSIPPYPPQVWSSFVSFASFSTSMMSSMSTAIYYKDYFGSGIGANLGLFMVASLLFFSIFQEVTYPLVRVGKEHLLTRLHGRFHELVVLLIIIFIGIVYTIVMLKV